MSEERVIVIGGGVIGCSIAYFLAGAGANVTLVERGKVGSGASDVAAGMVAALSENLAMGEPLNLALQSRALLLDLLPSLQAESGIDVEYRSPGILHVAVTEDEESELRGRLEWQEPLGMDVRWLGAQEVRRAEPALGEGVRGALFSPNEGHLNSRRLVRAYAQAAARRGANILQDTEVMGLTLQGNRVTGVKLAAGEMEADWVVMASGAWAGRCGEWLDLDIPVQPVRGQILSTRILPSPISSIVWRGITYLVPKADGAIVIGTTRERVGFIESSTLRGVSGILAGAIELVPAVADAELGHVWAGLRPGSPDDAPMLGPVGGWDGLLLAVGHYRSGILLSAATGKLIADCITKGDGSAMLPFALSRFSP